MMVPKCHSMFIMQSYIYSFFVKSIDIYSIHIYVILKRVGLGTFDFKHSFRYKTTKNEPTYKNDDDKKKLDSIDSEVKKAFLNAVKYSVKCGYRLIDGAELYRWFGSLPLA